MHRELSGAADLRTERIAEAQRAILQIETELAICEARIKSLDFYLACRAFCRLRQSGRNHIGYRAPVWDTTLTATAISRKASAVPTKLPATGTA
jgi:hypothetical protein